MKFLIVNCGSKKTSEILKKLTLLQVLAVEVVLQELKTVRLDKYKGIIISGAPILLTQTPAASFIKQIEPLVLSKLPVLGICFGHQLLGLSFGAKISRCAEDRNMQEISLVNNNNLFKGFKSNVLFSEDHCECINLPEDFILLASSKTCTNEAMKHKNLPLYGVQFHPETSGDNGVLLFNNFINICKTHYYTY